MQCQIRNSDHLLRKIRYYSNNPVASQVFVLNPHILRSESRRQTRFLVLVVRSARILLRWWWMWHVNKNAAEINQVGLGSVAFLSLPPAPTMRLLTRSFFNDLTRLPCHSLLVSTDTSSAKFVYPPLYSKLSDFLPEKRPGRCF